MEYLKQWPTITYGGRFSNIFLSHYSLKDLVLFESNFYVSLYVLGNIDQISYTYIQLKKQIRHLSFPI